MSPSPRPTPLLDRVNWPRDLRTLTPEQLPHARGRAPHVRHRHRREDGRALRVGPRRGRADGRAPLRLRHAERPPRLGRGPPDLPAQGPHGPARPPQDDPPEGRPLGLHEPHRVRVRRLRRRARVDVDLGGARDGDRARRRGRRREVVAIVGDGGLTGGVAMEGLNQAGYLKSKLIVILNDNDMSISPNVGAMSGYLLRIARGQIYQRVREDVAHILKKLPAGQKLAGLAEAPRGRPEEGARPGHALRGAGLPVRRPDRRPQPPRPRPDAPRDEGDATGPSSSTSAPRRARATSSPSRTRSSGTGRRRSRWRRARSRRRPRRRATRRSSPTRSSSWRRRTRAIVAITAAMPDGTGSTVSRRGSPTGRSTSASASSTPCSSPPAWRRRG